MVFVQFRQTPQQEFIMNKFTFPLSIASLLTAVAVNTASAQRYDDRATISVPIPGVRIEERGRDDRDGRGEGRAGYEIERLRGEVRQVRLEIGGSQDRRIRYQFSRVLRATEQLNSEYRRGTIRGWEVRRRAEEIRADLYRVQREVRERGGRGRDRDHDWR